MNLNLTFNACGGSATTQKLYYAKNLIASGSPLSGTGWVLYTGAPIPASDTSATLTGLDDNVDYIVYRYCNCPISGDNGPEIAGPYVKDVCASFTTITPGSTTVSYSISVPPSMNNVGTWIGYILVELINGAGDTLLLSNRTDAPFSSTINGSFTGLTANTNYKLRLQVSNTASTRHISCGTTDVQTLGTCTAPTVSINNVGTSSFDVNWSVPVSYAGDTYNILLNGHTQAANLSLGTSPYTLTGLAQNTLYQVTVQRNCGFGGTASTNSSATTLSSTNVIVSSTMGTGVVNGISGIPGFTLTTPLSAGQSRTGTHLAFSTSITFNVSVAPGIASNAVLRKNNVSIQCVPISSGFTGSTGFSPVAFTASDTLTISFNTGSCPP